MEIESIQSLQQRIMDFDVSQDVSYGGSAADYRRWALEVTGTGAAVIVSPTDDSGKITIILTDQSGLPASPTLCTAVYNHIMRPDLPEDRVAPINDKIQVVPPTTLDLTITATVELVSGYSVAQAVAMFVSAMQKYAVEAAREGEIKYTRVCAALSSVAVVNDFKELTLNGGTANISITSAQAPYIDGEKVTFTVGIV